MNIDLPDTNYTAKFTVKTVLAYMRPGNTSVEDPKAPPKCEWLNTHAHSFIALPLGH